MVTAYYPAIVERAGAGYSVFFPDLPGCTSAGATLQEAARAAEAALNGHLISIVEAGEALPDPSEMDDLERDPEIDEVARILVRGEYPGRSVDINVTTEE
ncbi:type II toxin-antitoxin system HicB family antitoxin [Rhizorhabdus histidinilytica]|uniref:Predicted nuclease of the RNAse H fold, HicB family n=1 Tax=Rhizorhabdus histidinilytica TaxID=439228 RepID=A0A1T5CFX5_9SPHN|nr:type II toxin-antitoxin system HicB family antitoxin [Rhizorhabdus histidinilytica]SKB58359.1 Predicted nuclease of the RNAse H fold, HicB family [Rhizorhabdus histidinilytica]